MSLELAKIRKAQVFVTHQLQAPVEQKREALKSLAEGRTELLRAFQELERQTGKFSHLPAEEAAAR